MLKLIVYSTYQNIIDYGVYLQAILFYMEWKGVRLTIFNPKIFAHNLT